MFFLSDLSRREGRIRALLLLTILVSFPSLAPAAEISSNGTGGGPWSDPATWRGKVPGPADDVVIQKNDIVLFDRNDGDKNSCKKLLIDPRGGLTFKPNAGKLVFAIADGIESYGVIRLDGTKSAGDHLELRLTGEDAKKRQIKLGKNAALLLYGRKDLPDDRRNVALVSLNDAKEKEPIVATVDTDGNVMIDWQRATIDNVKLDARKLDNTGAKPNERIKVADCRFTGHGRLFCLNCDTPEILRNAFGTGGTKPVEAAAIHVNYSPLAEIRGNTIGEGFAIGITVNYQSDTVLAGNTVEGCGVGIQGGYGIPNTMIKQTTVRRCKTGIKLEGASGVLEDVTIEGGDIGFHMENSNLQLNQFVIKDTPPKGQAILHAGGRLTLLNCNTKPEQIKLGPQGAKPAPEPVVFLQYVLIAAKPAPDNSLIEIRSASAPAGAADPNVRNSPAPLIDGLTPLPRTLNPLIAKSWGIDPAGKTIVAPEYILKVLGPAPKEGDRPVLKTVPFRPADNAFRADLSDATPTLELKVP